MPAIMLFCQQIGDLKFWKVRTDGKMNIGKGVRMK